MGHSHVKRIAKLEELAAPILPEDTMAEAGRKVLRSDFTKMLQHEAGSRSGEDIEEVHDMRVATRRLRSTFRLLGHCYKPKLVDGYLRRLRRTARALGAVRDLDVMLADMAKFQATLDEAGQAAFQVVCDEWASERSAALKALNHALDGTDYRRFVKTFSDFVTSKSEGISAAGKASDDEVSPFQLRHVLPGMLYECLATVRAYDTVLHDEIEVERLHALRIEFKRLRYAVTLFQEVLGPEIVEFIEVLKQMQDHLGRLQDIATFRDRLSDDLDDDDEVIVTDVPVDLLDGVLDAPADDAVEQHNQRDPLRAYLAALDAEEQELRNQFPALWQRFNTKTVQRKLALALASLK